MAGAFQPSRQHVTGAVQNLGTFVHADCFAGWPLVRMSVGDKGQSVPNIYIKDALLTVLLITLYHLCGSVLF